MGDMSESGEYAEGGRINNYALPHDSIPFVLSRGEAYVSRAAYDIAGSEMIAALNGGSTHVFVRGADGSWTDTEGGNEEAIETLRALIADADD